MSCQRNLQHLALVVCLAVSCSGISSSAFAQSVDSGDVKLFKLYDFDARFAARYLLDDRDASFSQLSRSSEARTTWEEELFLMTRSYVYHPGFLNIDFGGGPLLVQQKFASLSGSNKNSETLLNMLARFNFLDLKSYPFSFYYQRSHPSVTTSLSGRFLTAANNYGFRGRVGNFPWSSSLSVDFARLDQQGSGFGNVVDQNNETSAFTWAKNFWGGDQIEVRHNRSVNNSRSGSAGLPIVESSIDLDTTEVRVKNNFGKTDNVVVNQFFRRMIQQTQARIFSNVDHRSYSGSANWKIPSGARMSFRHRANEVKRDVTDSRLGNTQLSFADSTSENFRYEAEVGYVDAAQTRFDSQKWIGSGNATYRKETGFGSISVSGSVRRSHTDQVSSTDSIDVFDEAMTLVGTVPVELANEFVIESSVTVRNAASTQIFVEGLDYRLITVSSLTSVQSLIGGNIADGQSVLVDYRYQTSGTAAYQSTGKGISVSADLPRNTNIYARYGALDTDLLDGELTLPKNDAKTFEVGIQGEYPLWQSWSIGGRLSYTDRDEEISPSARNSFDVHLTGDLMGSLRLRLAAAFIDVDQENSGEDLKLQNYRAAISGRLWRRFNFNMETAYMKDTGGSMPRKQAQHRLQIYWGFRRVNFSLAATVSKSMQGVAKRDYTNVTAEISRAF